MNSSLNRVYVSKENLIHNLKTYQDTYKNIQFAPVLKSNAYGHGLQEVGRIIDKKNIPFLVVNSYEEAEILRTEGIRSKILVIGYTKQEYIKANKIENITFVITCLEHLNLVCNTTTEIDIHLKIDTGMHRQGILYDQVNESIDMIQSNKLIHLDGVCSHLADADNENKHYTKEQIKIWKRVTLMFQERFKEIAFYHIAATAGVPYQNEKIGNVVRLGIGLYGINPLKNNMHLKPALKMKSVIGAIKVIPAGRYIGYGCTHKTDKETKIAIVPVGYFEGVDRKLSNHGIFKVKNRDCAIAGRISMNISVIEIPPMLNAQVGDEVVVISDNEKDKNSIRNIARMTQKIPWEVLVHIPQHLPRIVI